MIFNFLLKPLEEYKEVLEVYLLPHRCRHIQVGLMSKGRDSLCSQHKLWDYQKEHTN